MSNITLGLAGAVGHDPAAAIVIDGQLVAAVEEERLIRRRHAKEELPFLSANRCLQIARVKASDVTHVAIPYAPISLFSKARWHYAYRHWYAPDRSIDSVFNGNRRYRRYRKELSGLLHRLNIPEAKIELVPVQHQLAHASSAYHLTDTGEKTAIFCVDGRGEYASIFLGYGESGKIIKVKEFYNPDSLCGMYAGVADYLGYDILDGEFKIMGVAPFGDPNKYDLSSLARFDGNRFKVNTHLVGTVGLRRFRAKSRVYYFSQKLIDMLGPRRVGNLVDDPYIHYAAGIQKLYEDIAVNMVQTYLGDVIRDTGRLAVAGTGSANIRLNQCLAEIPGVKKLVVHPACSDAGTAIGAATYASSMEGFAISPVKNMFLGPKFSSKQCLSACRTHRDKPVYELLNDPFAKAAELIAGGELVAWFRGRMEFGPRALGNRSILGNPVQEGIADLTNRQLKFREKWRPYSAAILDTVAEKMLEGANYDEYMCINMTVKAEWREQYPAIVYQQEGSTRAQIVTEDSNPDMHRLLCTYRALTGHGLLINTTLNRPGEALACTPDDAIDVFQGSDLNYMIMENVLVTKRPESDKW